MKSLLSKKELNYLAGIDVAKEYVVWGVPEGKNSEEILYTKAKSYGDANKVCKVLEDKYNAKKCRVQVLDLSTLPDFLKTIK